MTLQAKTGSGRREHAISVFGLGYVGCVTAALFAARGDRVLGVDINPDKVAMINAGKSPIVEKGLEELIGGGVAAGRLRATTDTIQAVRDTDISLICVATPSNPNGSLSLRSIDSVTRSIGAALENKSSPHCLVYRSTVLPGTTRSTVIPLLSAASKKTPHRDFDVCFNPEFLREGCSIADFNDPPFTLIGQETARGGDAAASLYQDLASPCERTTYEEAETVKYVCNCFHALKVAFANEIGTICKTAGIDGHRVMELVVKDRKLNVSEAYLKPGFAFGGSCLPKDLRALVYLARQRDVEAPLLASVLPSNQAHIQRVANRILANKHKAIGFLGLSFKEGTDDLRESPTVSLIEHLIGKGCKIRIFDSDVALARIFGANKAYIEHEIPHISSLMCATVEEVLEQSDAVVVSKKEHSFLPSLKPYLGRKAIYDLVRIQGHLTDRAEGYDGICW